MQEKLAQLLVDAEGRSEFVTVVVADIRGFSAFSTRNESPNIAMFIKRFYLQMLEKYFPTANFVKPTGDGLLLTFRYTERDLISVAKTVVEAAVKCVNEFATICEGDPMINFTVPSSIGFGISRGTACCLFSGNDIIDYSGHLLNLASRLNDLARPGGIVIDGGFLSTVLPEDLAGLFGEQVVYLRSIAEDTPIKVLYQKGIVTIPESALSPLRDESWVSKTVTYTVRDINKLGPLLHIDLDPPPKSPDRVRVILSFPKRNLKGFTVTPEIRDFEVKQNGPTSVLALNMSTIQKKLATHKTPQNATATITVHYVPKPLART